MVKRLKITEQTEPRILVVDDEADVRQVVTLSLQQAGLVVSSAENVSTARTLLEKESVDVIVSDVMMPGENARQRSLRNHASPAASSGWSSHT